MATIHVGVLRMELRFAGARTLKDRRRDLVSLRDRVRHRFPVTWNEVDATDRVTSRVVVCTTAGGDPRTVQGVLDRVLAFVEGSGRGVPVAVDLEVFPWHPPGAGVPVVEVEGG